MRDVHADTSLGNELCFSFVSIAVFRGGGASLPHEIRHIQSTAAFRTVLKTHLFKSYLY